MTKHEQDITRLLQAADSTLPVLAQSFKTIIEEIRNNLFDMDEFEAAAYYRNIEEALKATHISDIENLIYGSGLPKDERALKDHLNDIFMLGAILAIGNLSLEQQKLMAFDFIGERAVLYLREASTRMAQEVLASSVAGVRVAISSYLATATDTKKIANEIRGMIGLTEDQAKAVLNFRYQLETKRQWGLTSAQNRRLDSSDADLVRRQMQTGFMNQSQIDAMVEKYYRSMIDKRAMDIAATESLRYINAGQQEAWSQAVNQGVLNNDLDRKFWVTMGDAKVRPTHRVIPGMNPYGVKIDGYFATPHGPVQYPAYGNSGFVRCRCGVYLQRVIP